MREKMLGAEPFDAAVFIGGMDGVWKEYRMFHDAHPNALCFPIASTGAAALELYQAIGQDRRDLIYELIYPSLFRGLLKEIAAQRRGYPSHPI